MTFVRTQTTAERFWSKVETTSTCWLWLGALNDGYGSFRLNKTQTIRAHTFLVGPAPEGLEWDHLCRVRQCVRPSHLEAVVHKVNVQRIPPYSRGNAEKTECKFGHPFDAINTYVDRTGARHCRACMRLRAKAYYQKKKLVQT